MTSLPLVSLPLVVEDHNELGPPFGITTGRERPDSRTVWFAADALADTASGEAARMVGLHAAVRGMPIARHAASLVFQRYCHRVCGVAVAAWVRHGVALDLAAGNTAVRFIDGTPDLVAVEVLRAHPTSDPEEFVVALLRDHLEPVAAAVRSVGGPGLPNLLGNAAAGFAGAFRKLSSRHPAHELLTAAERITSADPRLARSGAYRILSAPSGRPLLHYDRATCCHWYAAPDGKFCSWCSRLTHEERTERFAAQAD